MRPDVVPFVTAYSGEKPYSRGIVSTPLGGIGYVFETPEDRDQHGVLWNGRAMARGRGKPRFGDVHPQRQRMAMQHLLCQVCGGESDRNGAGVLWLLEDNRGDWEGWPNDLLTAHPPVCLSCAPKAAAMCPHLEDAWVAVRVRESEVCAVHGQVWAPSIFGPPRKVGKKRVVAYGTPAARWVLAGQLVRALSGCTVVDLDDELARRSR
jgi:hypothetical protein